MKFTEIRFTRHAQMRLIDMALGSELEIIRILTDLVEHPDLVRPQIYDYKPRTIYEKNDLVAVFEGNTLLTILWNTRTIVSRDDISRAVP